MLMLKAMSTIEDQKLKTDKQQSNATVFYIMKYFIISQITWKVGEDKTHRESDLYVTAKARRSATPSFSW